MGTGSQMPAPPHTARVRGLRRLGSAVPLLLLLAACSTVDEDDGYEELLVRGVSELEADQGVTAVTTFEAALALRPDACEARLGRVLGHTIAFVAQTRIFNRGLFEDRAADSEALSPAAESDLVEKLLVEPLLLPIEAQFAGMTDDGRALLDAECELMVALPVKLDIGTNIALNAWLGPRWSTREGRLLGAVGALLLGADRLFLAHELEIPPLVGLALARRLQSADLTTVLRRIGAVPEASPTFLQWHSAADRAARFGAIPEDWALAARALQTVAATAAGYMADMPAWQGDEVIWVKDIDGSASVTTGDTVVFNIRGRLKIGQEVPQQLRPIEVRILPGVGSGVLDATIDLLGDADRIFSREVTPGTRIKLEAVNALFRTLGQSSPFEDVMEIDPLAWFLGRPTWAAEVRYDLNENCLEPEGPEAICACIPPREIIHPETGEPVTVSVPADITVIGPDGPEDACLREGLRYDNLRYPDPPAPQPLRAFLPYWYNDPLIPDEGTVFGVEGEKSVNMHSSRAIPDYLSYGDFHHFIFGSIQTDDGVRDLRLPPDCVAPPTDDYLGLVTLPYFAWRQPDFSGSVFVNLSILTGGDCPDGSVVDYRIWAPADLYSVNKVVAHYAARYGRLIYDTFTFLRP